MLLHVVGLEAVEAHIVVFEDFLKDSLYFAACFEPFGLICVHNALALIDKHFLLHEFPEPLRVERRWHR